MLYHCMHKAVCQCYSPFNSVAVVLIQMQYDVASIDLSEITNVTSLCTSESDSQLYNDDSEEKYFYFFVYHKGTGSPLQLRTTSNVSYPPEIIFSTNNLLSIIDPA